MAPASESEAGAEWAHDARGRPRPGWAVMCWVAVLVLTGTVQVLREQWFDTALFFSAAALTAAGPWLPGLRVGKRPRHGAMLGTLMAVGIGLSLLPRHSGWMALGLALVGAAALVLAWTAPAGRGCSRDRSGIGSSTRTWTHGLRALGIAWTIAVIAGCVWELGQFIWGYLEPTRPSYALSDLLDPLLDGWPGRAAFIAAWLAGGAFLLRRGGRT